VATAARLIIEASPAPHGLGGRPPGFAEAVAASEARRADLNNRFEVARADSPIGVEL
jgi:hypothetical protein